METIGSRVRAARQRLGKSLADVASETGCRRQTLAKLEQGGREQTLVRFARLARALDTTMDQLVPEACKSLPAQDEDEDEDAIPF